MSDRIDDFIIEAREHLGIVEESLLALEKDPGSPESADRVNRCFRSIHSIKGDAGFLGLQRIHELAHAMETILGEIRPPASLAAIESLLASRDRLAVMVDSPNQSRMVEISDLLERLKIGHSIRETSLVDFDLTDWNASNPGGVVEFILETAGEHVVRDGRLLLEACDLRAGLPLGRLRWTARVDRSQSASNSPKSVGLDGSSCSVHTQPLSIDLAELPQNRNGLVVLVRELEKFARIVSGRVTLPETDLRLGLPKGSVLWSSVCESKLTREEFTHQLVSFVSSMGLPAPQDLATAKSVAPQRSETISPAEVPVKNSEIGASKPPANPLAVDSGKSSTLRIQVELLDRLMTLVGELTLVRNQSLLAFADHEGTQRDIIQRLNSVTSELQEATLRARMQPVGNLFNKFPRMVRDLARQLGKQVEIELHGREVELDKTILEQLSDPLMHLIRNSVDHGIEMPEDRVAKGKSATGCVVLSATHEDGQVRIQIRDDGKGIDPAAIRAKAIALRLKTESELDRLSSSELHSLILLPGFSTAKTVTEISGRGVGMDVVKTNIEQLEGTLKIDSVFGTGCSMELRLPLTLAIIPCLIATVGDNRFAVPQRDLEEVVCLHPRSPGRIEQAFDTEVYRLRDQLLPIVRLADVLRHRTPFSVQVKATLLAEHALSDFETRISYILVLRHAGHRFGLVVDEVRGTHEIVVKPMHPSMKRVGIFAGATILGDGRVALITNCQGIVEHAQLSFRPRLEQPVQKKTVRDAEHVHRILLFESGANERYALPLLQIRRVEMIARGRIERVGNDEFVTVDGVSTRILRLNNVLRASPINEDALLLPLILPKFVEQPMGILASRIVDTESLALELQHLPDDDQGILGSAIVRNRLTRFLEMHRLSELLFAKSKSARPTSSKLAQSPKRILLVDDTAFFREVVKRYLNAEGHEVTTAIHGEDALNQLGTGTNFDIVVSDIEMPVMDGWEFATQVRRRGITLPMLALTSLSGPQYEAKARECGFDDFEVKLDHDRFVRAVARLLSLEGATK